MVHRACNWSWVKAGCGGLVHGKPLSDAPMRPLLSRQLIMRHDTVPCLGYGERYGGIIGEGYRRAVIMRRVLC